MMSTNFDIRRLHPFVTVGAVLLFSEMRTDDDHLDMLVPRRGRLGPIVQAPHRHRRPTERSQSVGRDQPHALGNDRLWVRFTYRKYVPEVPETYHPVLTFVSSTTRETPPRPHG